MTAVILHHYPKDPAMVAKALLFTIPEAALYLAPIAMLTDSHKPEVLQDLKSVLFERKLPAHIVPFSVEQIVDAKRDIRGYKD